MSCLHPFQSYVWAFGEILGCPGENTIKTNEDLKEGYGIISNARWRHQMETFSALPPLCVGIFRVTAPLCGDFPRYRPFVWGFHHPPPPPPPTPHPTPPHPHWPVTRRFDVFYLYMNQQMSNGDAGDLRHHRAHYDVTVIEHTFS